MKIKKILIFFYKYYKLLLEASDSDLESASNYIYVTKWALELKNNLFL
jgi:hypothetical protein